MNDKQIKDLKKIGMHRNRDDFSQAVKDILAKRVGFRCSNPECRKLTSGPQKADRTVNIGVAAHITAAAAQGPRYDSSMTPERRASAENGIWLCANCATLIDRDEDGYTVELLQEWKSKAEERAHNNISSSMPEKQVMEKVVSADIYNLTLIKEGMAECFKQLSLFKISPHIVLDPDNFPLPDNWEKVLENNNSFLGIEFTVKLHDICNNMIKVSKGSFLRFFKK